MNIKEKINTTFLSLIVLILLSFYIFIYCYLGYRLYSAYDEGFYYNMILQSSDVYTVQTTPLTLTANIIKSVFPFVENGDVLSLRHLAFYVRGLGIVFLLFSFCFFLYKRIKEKVVSSYLVVATYVLFFGLLAMPRTGVVVNFNDMLFLVGMIVLSCCLFVVSIGKVWVRHCFKMAAGFFSFFAILCSPPGGAMMGLLCFLFIVFYDGYNRQKLLSALIGMAVGVLLGVIIMFLCIISIADAVTFVQSALYQTTNGSGASHHSLSMLIIQLLFDVRDLFVTLIMLCGVTYLSNLIYKKNGKSWLAMVVGVLLFIVLYKWQVNPSIKFASILTWLVLMSLVLYEKVENKRIEWNFLVLMGLLYLLPFCIALGTNQGLLNKVRVFMVPWGLVLYCIVMLTRTSNNFFSHSLPVFIFVFCLFGQIKETMKIKTEISNTSVFSKEYPISRMHLNKNQFAFSNEVYGVLKNYAYQSKLDTILGFCFNEMTIVAMDAVPYTNDQYPEEFLVHDKKELIRPQFMILTEGDLIILKPMLEDLNWDFPNAYDVYETKNNPNPEELEWGMNQSYLYCLKSRKVMLE